MSIIAEQDQNNIYDLYQEGILTRARAGLGSFIGGGGIEGKLNNIIAQYKTKIGRELGDLEADFKTFKGSIQPAQRVKLNTLLTNLDSVGVQSAQSMLGKFGHMIGRVVGAAAPAAAVGAATAALGGAPALVGAAAGFTRGLKNVPRTDIGTASKLGKIGVSTGIGALAGYGADKIRDYMSGPDWAGPKSTGASLEDVPMPTGGGGNALDTFRRLHGGTYDPKSSVDAAKIALQQMGQEQGLTGKALQNFVYNNGGTTSMDGSVARETLQRLGTSMREVNSGLGSSIERALPPVPGSAYPDSTYASRISGPTDRIAPPISNSRFSGPDYADRITAPSIPRPNPSNPSFDTSRFDTGMPFDPSRYSIGEDPSSYYQPRYDDVGDEPLPSPRQREFNDRGINPTARGLRDVRDLELRRRPGAQLSTRGVPSGD